MRTVVALGGNALLRRGEPAEAATQRAHVLEAASALAALAAEQELVITHGNGPQVGLLALEADAYKAVAPYPLDVLGAESQGMIGYLLVQALGSELPEREVVALLTQVLVDPDDPAFAAPDEADRPGVLERAWRERLAADRGWTVARDGDALPPRRRLARAAGRSSSSQRSSDWSTAGSVVVCAGGGGIPVVADGGRAARRRGRDRQGPDGGAARRRARRRQADHADGRRRTSSATGARPRRRRSRPRRPAELRGLSFAAGSMGPKVEAACRFVERTGGDAVIGSLAELDAVSRGEAGTRIAAAVPLAVP